MKKIQNNTDPNYTPPLVSPTSSNLSSNKPKVGRIFGKVLYENDSNILAEEYLDQLNQEEYDQQQTKAKKLIKRVKKVNIQPVVEKIEIGNIEEEKQEEVKEEKKKEVAPLLSSKAKALLVNAFIELDKLQALIAPLIKDGIKKTCLYKTHWKPLMAPLLAILKDVSFSRQAQPLVMAKITPIIDQHTVEADKIFATQKHGCGWMAAKHRYSAKMYGIISRYCNVVMTAVGQKNQKDKLNGSKSTAFCLTLSDPDLVSSEFSLFGEIDKPYFNAKAAFLKASQDDPHFFANNKITDFTRHHTNAAAMKGYSDLYCRPFADTMSGLTDANGWIKDPLEEFLKDKKYFRPALVPKNWRNYANYDQVVNACWFKPMTDGTWKNATDRSCSIDSIITSPSMYAIINGLTPRGGIVSYVSLAYEHCRDIDLLYKELTDMWGQIRLKQLRRMSDAGFNLKTKPEMAPPDKFTNVFSKHTITMFCKLLRRKYREEIYGVEAVTDDPKATPIATMPELDRKKPFTFGEGDPLPFCSHDHPNTLWLYDILQLIIDAMNQHLMKKMNVALEDDPLAGYNPHLQIYVQLTDKLGWCEAQSTFAKLMRTHQFYFEMAHCGFATQLKYHGKEDSNRHWTNGLPTGKNRDWQQFIIEQISQNYFARTEAIWFKHVLVPVPLWQTFDKLIIAARCKHSNMISRLHLAQRMMASGQTFTKWQWQFLVHFFTQRNPSQGQKVYWIWSEEGATGKSWLCQFLATVCGGFLLVPSDATGNKHWAYLYNNEEFGVMDCSRSEGLSSRSFYSVLETFQSLTIVNRKYNAQSGAKPPTPVIVFANNAPWYWTKSTVYGTNDAEKTLSLGRWEVYKLKEVIPALMNLEQAPNQNHLAIKCKEPVAQTLAELWEEMRKVPVSQALQSRQLSGCFKMKLTMTPLSKDWGRWKKLFIPQLEQKYSGIDNCFVNWQTVFNEAFEFRNKLPKTLRSGPKLYEELKTTNVEFFKFDMMQSFIQTLRCEWLYDNGYDEWLSVYQQEFLKLSRAKFQKEASDLSLMIETMAGVNQ